LSYLGLTELIKKDGKDIKLEKAVEYVKDCIDNGKEYFDRNNKYVKYIIGLRKSEDKNKEHFADALLYNATKNIKHGLFTISKEEGGLGRCWLNGCKEVAGTRKIEFQCKNCKYKMKNNNSIEKILDIDKNSLFKLYEYSIRYLVENYS